VLQDGAFVLTTERGATRLIGRLPAGSQLVTLPGTDAVDLQGAVEYLRSRGHERILSEGGPTLFGSLAAEGLVDELFLTVSPLLAGQTPTADRLGLIAQTELLPARRLAGGLLSARRHHDHLFLRYSLGAAVAAHPPDLS
jgi:riboflavin biosynthesis pyrimidine reductase